MAIRRTVARQFHVGLLYKAGQRAKFRHQCEHKDLKDEEAGNPEYLWADIGALNKINKRLLASKMSKAGGDRVPYRVGFQSGREYIDKKTLKYASTEPGEGLTCSTYNCRGAGGNGVQTVRYGRMGRDRG